MYKFMFMYTSESSSEPLVTDTFQSFREAAKRQRWFKDKYPNAVIRYRYIKRYTVKVFANKTDRFPRIVEPVTFKNAYNMDKYIAMFPNGRITFEIE